MTTETNPTPEAVVAARRILELAEKATPGPWHTTIESCDCGDGFGCPHGDYPFDMRPTTRPEGFKDYDTIVESFGSIATVDDGLFIAEIRTLAPALAEIVANEPPSESTTAEWLKDALAALQKIADGHPYPEHYADKFLKRVKDSESFRPDCAAAGNDDMPQPPYYLAWQTVSGTIRTMDHRPVVDVWDEADGHKIVAMLDGTPRAIEPPPSGLEVRND